MKRIASLLIAVTLAVAPAADSTLCLVWCAAAHFATGESPACHGLGQSDPAVHAGNGDCGILLDGTPFVREETRWEVLLLALEHGGPIARSREIVAGGRIGFARVPVGGLAPPAFSAVLRI